MIIGLSLWKNMGMEKSELTWNLGTIFQVDLKGKESVNKSRKYSLETALDISQKSLGILQNRDSKYRSSQVMCSPCKIKTNMPGSLWWTKLHSKHNIWYCPHFSTLLLLAQVSDVIFSLVAVQRRKVGKFSNLLVRWEGSSVRAQTEISLQTKHVYNTFSLKRTLCSVLPKPWKIH